MGDRTLGAEPMRVAALGRAVIEGLADGGVVGIVKHMPGHGRAMVDSHHELPIVTADRSEEHTSELQSLMRISYAVFCLKKKKHRHHQQTLLHNIHYTYKHTIAH